jgi:hypothetical protein
MSWPAWPKGNEKALAGYAVASTANAIRLRTSTAELIARGDLTQVVRELYEAFLGMDIRWSRELYRPDDARQEVRTPHAILHGAGDGTCLDLALLLAGAALGKELVPAIVVLDGHALVALSTRTERRRADGGARRQRERRADGTDLFVDGICQGPQAADHLRELVASGEYVLLECTGFAQAKEALSQETPEGTGRTDGLMSFERAVEAGLEQLGFGPRAFEFAVDVAYLQDVVRVEVYEPGATGLERIDDDLRRRQELLVDQYHFVAGREAELGQLDDFIASTDSGYALVTGDPGTGKTALLAEWIRRLNARPDVRTIFHFISRQYGTADGQVDYFQSLLQQASWAWERPINAPSSLTALETSWLDLLDVARPPQRPVVIVIDGVDECQGWSLSRTSFPRRLPSGVHLVVSARGAQDEWRYQLGLNDALALELFPLDEQATRALLDAVEVPRWLLEPEAFSVLVGRAQGDPFYLTLLCDQVSRGEIADADDLARVEQGIGLFLKTWWMDLSRTATDAAAQSLLSYLSVALAPMTSSELIDIKDDDPLSGFTFTPALEAVKRYVRGDHRDVGVALAHWRLKDYIANGVLSDNERRRVKADLVSWCERWSEHYSRYALTKVVGHQLADLGDLAAAQRRARLRASVTLLCDRDYQTARVEKAGDAAGLVADMTRVISRLSTESEPDVTFLVAMALLYADARDQWLQPSAVFDLAEVGEWQEAVQRLQLLPTSDMWLAAARLSIAWLAADAAGAGARQLLDAGGVDMPVMVQLTTRVRRAVLQEPDETVPPVPSADGVLVDRARTVLARLTGGVNAEYYEGIEGVEPVAYGDGNQPVAFGVDFDAPILVQAATAHPEPGDSILDEYIELQGANPYADYRNRTLEALLGHLLALPDSRQARRHVVHVVECALNPAPVRFCDYLPMTLERHRRPAEEYRSWLRDTAESVQQEAEWVGQEGAPVSSADAYGGYGPALGMHAAPGPGRERDLWSFQRRRLAAIAEALASVGESQRAQAALHLAAQMISGFAGFRAPALLTCAEASLIVVPDDQALRRAFLDGALVAAHNIQDQSFCARSTAMVNAAMLRLDGGTDVAAEVEQFVTSHTARLGTFGSRFRIGETFDHRVRRSHLPIEGVTAIDTLERLAADVLHVPIAALENANPGLARADDLAPGTWVAVPDPAFVPIFAAWLSADVLASGLGDDEKVRLLARLVPFGVSNLTVLDTLLGRLVGIADDIDADELADAISVARTFEPQGGVEYHAHTGYGYYS